MEKELDRVAPSPAERQAGVLLIKKSLHNLIEGFLDNPEELQVSLQEGELTTVFIVKTAKSEMGKIIGKQGKMAEALRTVLQSLAAKYKVRAVLEILD